MYGPDQRVRRPRTQHGFGLIELMISLVIALVITLAAASSAMVFNATQKQTLGAGAAGSNAAATLAVIKEEVGQAGLGFFGEAAYLCSGLNLSVGTSNLSMASFSPVQVVRTAGVDQLDVMYASSVTGGANVLIKQASDKGSAVTKSYLPAAVGDAILLAPATPVDPCSVRSVTAVSTTLPLTLTFGASGTGNQYNQVAFASPATYAADARINHLGNLSWTRFRLDGSNLLLEQPMTGASAIMARNVIAFRVQYGVSAAAGQSTISTWQEPTGAGWTPLSVVNTQRLRAVKVGIVVRSDQPEKKEGGTTCVATSDAPQVFDFVTTPPDVGGVPWNCYRYRTSVVTVPLRNWVMGLQS
jgi:type IV pilus assembly protein PilW